MFRKALASEEQDRKLKRLLSDEDVTVTENFDIGKSPGRFKRIVELQVEKSREQSNMTGLKSWLR